MNYRIILASQSPRRQELLRKMGLKEFRVVPSHFEEYLDTSLSAGELVIELARGKVSEVAHRFPDAIVIGGDTLVEFEGKQLGKSPSRQHAKATLQRLSGKSCAIHTSLVVMCLAEAYEYAVSDTATVRMKIVSDKEIDAYLETNEWIDKAGAFGIQESGHLVVETVAGDYSTALGLPTRLLAKQLQHFGVIVTPANSTNPYL